MRIERGSRREERKEKKNEVKKVKKKRKECETGQVDLMWYSHRDRIMGERGI